LWSTTEAFILGASHPPHDTREGCRPTFDNRSARPPYGLSGWPSGDPDALSARQRQLVDEIIDTYGRRSGGWLSELTHSEEPWRLARQGLPDSARSAAIIAPAVMKRYYRSQEEHGRGAAAAALP
jgi:hypothetical protein